MACTKRPTANPAKALPIVTLASIPTRLLRPSLGCSTNKVDHILFIVEFSQLGKNMAVKDLVLPRAMPPSGERPPPEKFPARSQNCFWLLQWETPGCGQAGKQHAA
jgi:hypothetical protein